VRNIVNIFATRSDLEAGIRAVESTRKLQYVLCGLFDTPALIAYSSLLDVENLGTSQHGDHIRGKRFLVIGAFRQVDVRVVPQRRGGTKYAVDQEANPGSITILPGGLFQNRCLLAGQIGTVADDEEALALYRDFASLVTKGFKRVKTYKVGPEALALLQRGVRLTTGADTPTEYDLTP
jgi:hypothetical protein